ncbi:MAG: hypothetical protein U1F20_04515 [Lysobacterales bacterium]
MKLHVNMTAQSVAAATFALLIKQYHLDSDELQHISLKLPQPQIIPQHYAICLFVLRSSLATAILCKGSRWLVNGNQAF